MKVLFYSRASFDYEGGFLLYSHHQYFFNHKYLLLIIIQFNTNMLPIDSEKNEMILRLLHSLSILWIPLCTYQAGEKV